CLPTRRSSDLYYQDDHEGSVTHLTSSIGSVIENYRYDVFGAPTINGNSVNPSSAFNNRFMFTGREYTSTFGVYEYRARAYHPGLGRFTGEDPKGFEAGDYNLFRYCHNDPEDFTDPLGLNPGDPFPSAVAAGADAAKFINPTSIKNNQEYGGIIYQSGGMYYATSAGTAS